MLVNNFINKLNKIITEKNFKEKINEIIKQIDDSTHIVKNNTLVIIKNESTYIIKLNKNSIEYHIFSQYNKNQTDNTNKITIFQKIKSLLTNNQLPYKNDITFEGYINDDAGKLYKVNGRTITKYCKSRITKSDNYEEIKSITTTNVFNQDNIEIFQETITDNKNYTIKNGKKELIIYDDNGYAPYFENNIRIERKIRTPQNRIIRIEETTYYTDNLKKYNNKEYSIGYNYGNFTASSGTYTIIPKELYLNYTQRKITEEELFKHFVKIKSNMVCC